MLAKTLSGKQMSFPPCKTFRKLERKPTVSPNWLKIPPRNDHSSNSCQEDLEERCCLWREGTWGAAGQERKGQLLPERADALYLPAEQKGFKYRKRKGYLECCEDAGSKHHTTSSGSQSQHGQVTALGQTKPPLSSKPTEVPTATKLSSFNCIDRAGKQR